MRSVSIRDANQQFSRLIEYVEAGKTVVIMLQGKPVAQLTPRPAISSADLDGPTRH